MFLTCMLASGFGMALLQELCPGLWVPACHVGSGVKWKDKTLWVGTFPAISVDPTGQSVSLFTGDESEVMEPVQSQL